jgi:spermidine synthase
LKPRQPTPRPGDSSGTGLAQPSSAAPWAIAYLAFFLSGIAGLMHEVVWSHLLVELIGATAYAQSAVLAVFMAGLALGSLLFGRRVDRKGRALRTYVVLEVAIGLYCLLLPVLLQIVATGYIYLAERTLEMEGPKLALRLGLAVLVVLPPAVWMGGTLPLIARHLIEGVDQTQRRVASLYALNSFGAVVGAGLAGFVVLPELGIFASLFAAAALNFGAGGLGALLERRGGERTVASPAPQRAAPGEVPAYAPATYRVTLLALGLSGFAAMGYEVVFIRIISLSFGSSTYSFTVMLMCFIAGTAIGSALVSRLRVPHPLWWLATSQMLVVTALLAVTPLVARLPYLTGLLRIAFRDDPSGFGLFQLASAGLCLAVLLVPTACLGFGFPLVAQIQARHPRDIGSRVGTTYAWNTLGNVLGALGTSLFLLPALGVLGAFHLNLGLSLAAGFALMLVATEVRAAARLAITAGVVAVAVLYATLGLDWIDSVRRATGHLRLRTAAAPDASGGSDDAASSFANWQKRYVHGDEDLLFLEDDAHVTVLVWGEGDQISLNVNGKPDATAHQDLPTQLLLAHAPLFLNLDARSVLVIGHGSGITAGSVLRHPVERLDVVEISSSVLNADHLFRDHNYGVLADPRTHAYVDDGQSFLRTVPRKYDVIISEPSNPWISGIGGLFTVDFFEAARSKLNPGGVFCLWFHAYEQSDETLDLVVRTLGAVFPHAVMFTDFDFMDLVWVASESPIVADFGGMEARFDEPAIRNDLARIGVTNLAGLLLHHAVSAERFQGLLGPGPVNTSSHQLLEYAAARSFFREDYSDRILDLLPYYRRGEGEPGAFLERYVKHRSDAAEPVSGVELGVAAAHLRGEEPGSDAVGEVVAEKVGERAAATDAPGAPPSRPARGAVPQEMGLYELRTWSERLFEQGQFQKAAALLQKALAERPASPDLVHAVAFGLQEEGDKQGGWALIETGFERAIDAAPPHWRTAEALADLLRLDEDSAPRAREFVRRRLEARPGDARLLALAARLASPPPSDAPAAGPAAPPPDPATTP